MELIVKRDLHRNNLVKKDIPNTAFLTDSLINEYVPFYSLFNAEYKKVGENRYMMYSFPEPNSLMMHPYNRVSYFDDFFKHSILPLKFVKGSKEYFVCKQFLFDLVDGAYNPLYILAIKKEYIYSIDFEHLDLSKFVVLINNNFKSEDRKLMFKFVERTYLSQMESAGIDIVYTSNIQNWCFKKPEVSFAFPTIAQMREFFTETTKEVLYGITGKTPQSILRERSAAEESRRLLRLQRDEERRVLREREREREEIYRRLMEEREQQLRDVGFAEHVREQQQLQREANPLQIIDDSGQSTRELSSVSDTSGWVQTTGTGTTGTTITVDPISSSTGSYSYRVNALNERGNPISPGEAEYLDF